MFSSSNSTTKQQQQQQQQPQQQQQLLLLLHTAQKLQTKTTHILCVVCEMLKMGEDWKKGGGGIERGGGLKGEGERLKERERGD